MTLPADNMRPFAPISGRWKTSGVVLDDEGATTMTIDGTDDYEWMAGGHWIIHRVDVTMGEDHTQAIEHIGDHDPETGAYSMRAFDASGQFDVMTARHDPDGSWRIEGDGVRTTLCPREDKASMTALWERQADDDPERSLRWMEVRFEPTG